MVTLSPANKSLHAGLSYFLYISFTGANFGKMALKVEACGGARGVMVIVVGNGYGDTSSNLDEADCISHSTHTLEKGINPNILPLAMGTW